MQKSIRQHLANKHTYLKLALIAYVGMVMLDSIFFRVAKILHVESFQWMSAIFPLVLLLVYLLMGDRTDWRKLIPFGIFYAVFLLYATLSYLHFPQHHYWFFESSRGVVERVIRPDSGMYAILFLTMFDDDEFRDVIRTITVGVWLIFIHDVLQYARATIRGYWLITDYRGTTQMSGYDLDFSYSMIFVSVYFFYRARTLNVRHLTDQIFKTFYYAASLLTLIIVVKNGARGALMIPLVYLVLMALRSFSQWRTRRHDSKELEDPSSIPRKRRLHRSLRNAGFKRKHYLLIAVLLVLLLVIVGLLIYDFSRATRDPAPSHEGNDSETVGQTGRNVSLLLKGEFLSDNGRKNIFGMMVRALSESPVKGLGLIGSRAVIGQKLVWGYPHNEILEFMSDFGVVVGLLFCIVYIVICCRMIFMEKDDVLAEWFMVFLAISMALMFSLSYWHVYYPWITLVIYFKYSTQAKKDRKRWRHFFSKSRKCQWLKKGAILLASVLLVVITVTGIMNMVSYHKTYRSKCVEIDRPTVVLTFDFNYATDYDIAYRYLKAAGVEATTYLIPERLDHVNGKYPYLDTFDVERMLKDDAWDFQLGTPGTVDLSKFTPSERADLIHRSLAFYRDHHMPRPRSVSLPKTLITDGVRTQLMEDFSVIKVTGRPSPDEPYYYKTLTPETLTRLYALDVTTNVKQEHQLENIYHQIDLAKDQNALIVLTCLRVSDSKQEPGFYVDYFCDLIDYLRSEGFTFMTMRELEAMAPTA